jgi:hypothetical protein
MTPEPINGRPTRTKSLIGIGIGLGLAKEPLMLLSVRISRKTFRLYFYSGKMLFIPEIGKIMAFYIVVMTRGLLDPLGFRYT